MAQNITRQPHTVFGNAGATSNFAKFGSQAIGSPVKTKNIQTIQALAAWSDGWQDAVAIGQAPYEEDMNSVIYEHSYQVGYSLAAGVPEWDASTTYDYGSVVKSVYTGSGGVYIYVSIVDGNLNNALPTGATSNGSWQFLYAAAQGGMLNQGITNGSGAPAGCRGEVIEGLVPFTSAAALANSGVWAVMASITLTPGNWQISALVAATPNGATSSVLEGGVDVTGGSSAPSSSLSGITWASQNFVNTVGDASICIPPFVKYITVNTTYYLKASGIWSVALPLGWGNITAIRI